METKVHRLDHKPSLEEAQQLVGGYVEMVRLPDGKQMLVNEDGRSMDLPLNKEATEMLNPNRPGIDIVGDVVVLEGDNRWD